MVNDLDAWHARTTEEIIEPELEICDPHHHFWDRSEIRPGGRYLLDELLSDTNSGHRITETVFIECSSMYRKDGPTAMSPVGETEFVNGLAAMSASGQYGDTKVAAGIVGFADLSLGSAVEEVLVAHKQASPDRFRGIRHAAVWDDDPDIRRYKNPPKGLLYERNFREGFAVLEELDLSFEAWTYHHQLREVADLAKSFPGVRIILNHIAGPIGIGTLRGQVRRSVRSVVERNRRTVRMPECRRETRWFWNATGGTRLARTGGSAWFKGGGRPNGPLVSALHRKIRNQALYVRKQFSRGQGVSFLPRPVERIQKDSCRIYR